MTNKKIYIVYNNELHNVRDIFNITKIVNYISINVDSGADAQILYVCVCMFTAKKP